MFLEPHVACKLRRHKKCSLLLPWDAVSLVLNVSARTTQQAGAVSLAFQHDCFLAWGVFAVDWGEPDCFRKRGPMQRT